MKKFLLMTVLFAMVIVLQAFSQDEESRKFKLSGDLTTSYTLGNANDTQKIPNPGDGMYVEDGLTAAKKNGYIAAANLYVDFIPFSWLESQFKIYAVSRSGSVYLPLQMENLDKKGFELTLDSAYAKIGIFNALNLNLPVELYLKGGKFKSAASAFGVVSKYGTEQNLYMMTTKNDFTYEIGIDLNAPIRLNAAFAINYRLNEATQRYYDEDGMEDHGTPVPDKFAPQMLAMVKLINFNDVLSAELIYGNNVSNIYSGHSFGASARYNIGINEKMTLPIGLMIGYYQKNIDLLANAAVIPAPGRSDNTMDFRDTFSAGLGVGLRMNFDVVSVAFNVAGTFNMIKHYYRDNLNIVKLSADAQVTFLKNYFIGGGFIAGTLTDALWKTKDSADLSKGGGYFEHTFTLAHNLGYEVYAGINFARVGKFVIGFNQNKGLALNNMLEAKTDAQIKYKQLDSEWIDRLVEAGGLYFKFTVNF